MSTQRAQVLLKPKLTFRPLNIMVRPEDVEALRELARYLSETSGSSVSMGDLVRTGIRRTLEEHRVGQREEGK